MKTRPLIFLMAAAWLTFAMKAPAQVSAPDSLAGSFLTVGVRSGYAPFATNGTYRIFISVTGTNYTVLGRAGPLCAGACQYLGTGSLGAATLVDSKAGPGMCLQLSFASATNGTLTLTNANGFQTGVFTLTSYAIPSPPQLFLPGLASGQFQGFLGGQPGFIYAVETSGNLVNWQPSLNVALADLSTNFSAAIGQGACYFRARLASTAFGPADLTNKTVNLTISDGASPMATNGIYQWVGDTNDTGYQIIGGPGVASSSGTYAYVQLGPDDGMISCQDSLAGVVNSQIVLTSPQSGYFYTTNSSGFQSGTFTMAEGSVEFLGNVTFTPDTAKAQSLAFAADGSPASLSVTNGAGWVWMLNFPADALIVPRTITMTPFASVNDSNSLLPVTAGVQLEPDGIQFNDGVTLTVTPPSPLGSHATLLMAADDGSAIYFVQTTNQANTYSTTLFHFSSAEATDPSEQQWNNFANTVLPKLEADYQNAVNQLSALERLVVQPPEPPDYDWKCDPNDNAAQDAQIDAYQTNLFAKETAAIQRVISLGIQLRLYSDPMGDNAISVSRQLIETAMYRKVDTLFSQYSGDPKKMRAVSCIAINVSSQDMLFSGDGRQDWIQETLSWGSRVVDYYFGELRDEHLYSKALVVFQVEQSMALLGADVDTEELLNKLANALTFQLTVDMNFSYSDWDSDGTIDDNVQEEVTGNVTLQAGMSPPYQVVTNRMKFVSGTWACPADQCSYSLDAGQSSTWRISLGLQACGQPAQTMLIFDGPLRPFETWTGCDEVSSPNPWLGAVWGVAFVCQSGANGSGGLFVFPLSDGEAEIVNETVQGDSLAGPCSDPLQHATGAIQLQLQHTPQ